MKSLSPADPPNAGGSLKWVVSCLLADSLIHVRKVELVYKPSLLHCALMESLSPAGPPDPGNRGFLADDLHLVK